MANPLIKAKEDSFLASEHVGTPPEILEHALKLAGVDRFDLDPCWNEHALDTATHKLTKEDNGLLVDWGPYASVYCNPPYSTFGQRTAYSQAEDYALQTGNPVVTLTPFNPRSEIQQSVFSRSYAAGFAYIGYVHFLDQGVEAKTSAAFVPLLLRFFHSSVPVEDIFCHIMDIAHEEPRLLPIFTRPVLLGLSSPA